jgi:hypothetical protein
MIANPLEKGLGEKIEMEKISLDRPKREVKFYFKKNKIYFFI